MDVTSITSRISFGSTPEIVRLKGELTLLHGMLGAAVSARGRGDHACDPLGGPTQSASRSTILPTFPRSSIWPASRAESCPMPWCLRRRRGAAEPHDLVSLRIDPSGRIDARLGERSGPAGESRLLGERLVRPTSYLKTAVDSAHIPGAVIAISREGQLAYFETVGYRDAAMKALMPPEAIFSIGSMTIMMLHEEGAGYFC